MPVYMIRAGEHGPVKIGYAADPQQRLAELQVSHWEKLWIMRMFVGGEVEERILHAQFADLWLRGEWFSFSRSMLRDVRLEEHSFPAPNLTDGDLAPVVEQIAGSICPDPRGRSPVLAALLARRNGVRDIAQACGVSTAAVSQWRKVPSKHVGSIAALTGLSVSDIRDAQPERDAA